MSPIRAHANQLVECTNATSNRRQLIRERTDGLRVNLVAKTKKYDNKSSHLVDVAPIFPDSLINWLVMTSWKFRRMGQLRMFRYDKQNYECLIERERKLDCNHENLLLDGNFLHQIRGNLSTSIFIKGEQKLSRFLVPSLSQ